MQISIDPTTPDTFGKPRGQWVVDGRLTGVCGTSAQGFTNSARVRFGHSPDAHKAALVAIQAAVKAGVIAR